MCHVLFFFFFQAEDGIRDYKVTGVQTCALPISTTPSGEFLFQVFGALAQYERALIQERVVAGLAAARKRGRIGGRPQAITGEKLEAIVAALDGGMSKARSGERRVGEECRSPWSPYHLKKK